MRGRERWELGIGVSVDVVSFHWFLLPIFTYYLLLLTRLRTCARTPWWWSHRHLTSHHLHLAPITTTVKCNCHLSATSAHGSATLIHHSPSLGSLVWIHHCTWFPHHRRCHSFVVVVVVLLFQFRWWRSSYRYLVREGFGRIKGLRKIRGREIWESGEKEKKKRREKRKWHWASVWVSVFLVFWLKT